MRFHGFDIHDLDLQHVDGIHRCMIGSSRMVNEHTTHDRFSDARGEKPQHPDGEWESHGPPGTCAIPGAILERRLMSVVCRHWQDQPLCNPLWTYSVEAAPPRTGKGP